MKIKNSNVLITGGASGIGKIMGRMALEKGAKALIIWDINEKNIASTVEEFSVKGRHDACIALRCPVIVEAIAAIAIAQHIR